MATSKKSPQGIAKTISDLGDFLGTVGYESMKPGGISTGALNLYGTVDNWLMGKAPTAAGQGRGDVNARAIQKKLAQQYPKQYAADKSKIVTPANAGIVNPVNNARSGDAGLGAALKNIAGQKGAAVPSASTAARTGSTAKSIYDYLNVDPTAIYKPLVDLVQQQRDAANDRYKKNLGDITNIFSALTSVAPADRLRINEQFKNMLTAQQTALATRTAAATAQGDAGAAQAVASGAERGSGDAMVLNPLQTATAEGIAESNKIASIWEGLQGANQAQALEDVDNRGAGYTAQQLAATQALQQSLGDRLMGIAGTEADIQSQLAQQKFGIAQDIGQAKYSNALAQQQATARAAAAANSPAKTSALQKVRATLQPGQFDALVSQLDKAATRAYGVLNPAGYTGRGVSPKPADILSEWVNVGGNRALIEQARTIANTIYGGQ